MHLVIISVIDATVLAHSHKLRHEHLNGRVVGRTAGRRGGETFGNRGQIHRVFDDCKERGVCKPTR